MFINFQFMMVVLFILLTVIAGCYFKLLTVSGSIAAAMVGFLTVLGLDVKGLILLGIFFATSGFWSKYKKNEKAIVGERNNKGDRRDWLQVAANGGAAAVFSFFYFLNQNPIWLFAFSIVIASSNSDTWASEIGTLSKSSPFSIRTFSTVPKGTSGAVSLLGTAAGIFGSAVIALSACLLFDLKWSVAILVFLLGFLGNVIDTILGAFVQAVYQCSVCQLKTEKVKHCGQKTKLIKGNPLFNNEMVNFSSGCMAAVIGIIVYSAA